MNEHTEENRFEVARNRLRRGWAFATGVGREMRGFGAPFARGVGTVAQFATVGVGGMVAAGLPAYLVSKYGFGFDNRLSQVAGLVSVMGGLGGLLTSKEKIDNEKKIAARGIIGVIAGSALGLGVSFALQRSIDGRVEKKLETVATQPAHLCEEHKLKTGDQLIRKGPDGVPVLTVCP